MVGLAWQRRKEGEAGLAATSVTPAAEPPTPASSVRVLLARVLPSMVARGHGLDTLCLYLAIARAALLDLVVALGLPTPQDRPHRRGGGRKAWSPGDVGDFIELWVTGWRAGSLAERFGRTPHAIWAKRKQLGLPKRDRKLLVSPSDAHAPLSAQSTQRASNTDLLLATRAFDVAARPPRPARAPRAPAPAPSPAEADLSAAASAAPPPAEPAIPETPVVEEAAAERAIPGLPVAASAEPAIPARSVMDEASAEPAIPALSVVEEASAAAAAPSQVAAIRRATAAQSELPVVLSGPELRGPAHSRRAHAPAPAQARSAPLLPLLVPLLVAKLAAAKPNASAAVKAIRKHLLRAASDPLAPPAIKRRVRKDGRVECDWGPASDLSVGYCHLGGQHDFYAAAALGLTVSCLRTRKWVTELPHQIRGQTVEEFNPAWAEETIDAWGLRLQQCHAYRDIKGVEFWFWAKIGDGRIFSKRAKSKLWFRERASSGDYAY